MTIYVLVMSLLAVGAYSHSHPNINHVEDIIPFTTVEHGYDSAIEHAKTVVIRSEQEFEALWNDHIWSERVQDFIFSPPPKTPTIDFDKNMVVCLFRGTMSHVGHELKVTDVTETDTDLTVHYKTTDLPPGSILLLSLEQPFHIIQIPTSKKNVIFEKSHEIPDETIVTIVPTIGIDLGTTNSCVGIFHNGRVEIIPNEQGNRVTPSYVAFVDGGERLIGDDAKNQATINPENTIFNVKRLIGRNYSDKSVQADMKLLPYGIVADNNKPYISVDTGSGPQKFSPEEIAAMILGKMKVIAETFLGKEVKDAVVTVPAYFNDAQRQATRVAGSISGLNVIRILNEPDAAAIAYGMDRSMGMNGDESIVLVFDLGGGTFDVTLLSIDNGVFEILSTNRESHLGGEDFDQRVMHFFIKMIKDKSNVDITGDKRALQKLRTEVERAKRVLSSQQQVRLEIEDLVEGFNLSETLTRAQFEELNNDLFMKTLEIVGKVMDDADMSKNQIDKIVLVGGSMRIPKVQSLISEYFGGKELLKEINPDEAVTYGAAPPIKEKFGVKVVTSRHEEL